MFIVTEYAALRVNRQMCLCHTDLTKQAKENLGGSGED